MYAGMYPGQAPPAAPPPPAANHPPPPRAPAGPAPDTASAIVAQSGGAARPNIFARGAGTRVSGPIDEERRKQIRAEIAAAIGEGDEEGGGAAAPKKRKEEEQYMECYAGCVHPPAPTRLPAYLQS